MKKTCLPLFLIFSLTAYCQLPNDFQIENYVEIFQKDSIKIFFNCTGTVTDKKCASYYRIGKMDSSIINVTGFFSDYYIDGSLFLNATMINNGLEGPARFFYKNGSIMEEGSYKKNIRDGVWTYYYANGNIQKVINYSEGEPIVISANSINGKVQVINENGSFKTEFSTYKQCDYFEAWGDIVNGKKNGKWIFSNPNARIPIATEIYSNGKFVKGYSGSYEYTENPKINLVRFYPSENLSLTHNSPACPGDNLFFWEYKNADIHTYFYPELLDHMTQFNLDLKDQWLVIGIKIDKKNQLSDINVASSIDDNVLEKRIYDVLQKMNDWKTAVVNSKKTESNIFFTILIYESQIIIPVDYILKNGSF